MPNWKRVIVSGSDAALASLSVTNAVTATSFTGSLLGTASYATRATTASYVNPLIQNIVVTGSLLISGSINSVNYIDFNTSYTATQPIAGRLSWNSSDGTLDLGMKGGNVTQQIGQEIFYEVRNETLSTISNGTLLYANGVTAGSGRITAAPFTADGSVREVRLLGIATEDISNGVNGFVTHFGYVRDLDTRGNVASSIAVGDETWAVGDILYAHPTAAGKLTNVRPKHEISVAIVIIRHASTGVVFVRPTSYGHLDDIHDVNINTGSLAAGDLLVYDSSLDYWINSKQLTGSYGLTGSLTVTNGVTGSLLGTGSYALQALSSSYATNGGVTSIVAGTNITISPTNGLGAVTINSSGGTLGFNTTASFTNSSTWTFNHNLDRQYVVIQALDANNNQILPQNIAYTNNNTATITFPTAESGTAIASIGGIGTTAATASYVATASYAISSSNTTTSSYALTASYINPLNQTLTLTGSFNQSGSITIASGSITITSGSITMPNRPAFRITGNGGGTTALSYLSGSKTTIDYNQGGHYDNTTGIFTAPISGLYQVNVVTRTNSNSLGTISQLIVYKNNTTISPGPDGTVQIMVEYNSNTSMNHAGGSTISYLAAGDTLRMVVAVGQISFDGNDNFSVAYIG